MKKLTLFAIAMVVTGAFVAGVAIGKTAKDAKFVTKDELKWEELSPGGPKIANLTGDYKKGAYIALLQLPAGAVSPMHSHTNDYEAVEIAGTSMHWFKGEDGTKAKKLVPGSYWLIPGKVDHVSACEKGTDCLIVLIQKTKFDLVLPKEAAGSGSAAKPAAGSGSAKK